MWFGHIPCPQFSSFPSLHSEIPQNFHSYREKRGRKSPSSTVFSQGFLHTKEIIFETESKPSVEKISSHFPLFSVIWLSLQLNSFKCFKQVCLTSPEGCCSIKTNRLAENTHKTLHLVEPEPHAGQARGRTAPGALPRAAEPGDGPARPPPLPGVGPASPMTTATFWFICPVIIRTHYNHLEQHYRPHYGLGTRCH